MGIEDGGIRHKASPRQKRSTQVDDYGRLERCISVERMMRTRTPPVLDRRTLNRALLARQLLLRRWSLSVSQALERLVGLQAQAPNPPYFGLWTRLEKFKPEALSKLISDRKAVRIALMRSTIHLVTARDCFALRSVVQPVIERSMLNSPHGRGLKDLDIKSVLAAGRALLEQEPRTYAELGELLKERWPDRVGLDLAYALRTYAPLVQVPPRGLWNNGGPAAHTIADSWLPKTAKTTTSVDGCMLRYLKAFGPASVNDAQAWSGLTRLREVFERLRPKLRVFRDEGGIELFDLPNAPRPEPDTPSPLRFLPEFDNLLLSHADRSRVIASDHRKQLSTLNGMPPGTVLLDGFVSGTWKIKRSRTTAVLRVESFVALPKRDRSALSEEGAKLLNFAASDVAKHEIQFGLRA